MRRHKRQSQSESESFVKRVRSGHIKGVNIVHHLRTFRLAMFLLVITDEMTVGTKPSVRELGLPFALVEITVMIVMRAEVNGTASDRNTSLAQRVGPGSDNTRQNKQAA